VDCLQDVETFQDPVPLPEGADDWDRSHSVKQAPGKDGCMLKLDPDASPKKDAAAKLCSLDKLEDWCCSGFEKEVGHATLTTDHTSCRCCQAASVFIRLKQKLGHVMSL